MRIAHCFNVPTIYPFLSPTRLSIVSLSSSSYEYPLHRTESLWTRTVFKGSKKPLCVWYGALYFVVVNKNGVSASALKRLMGFSSCQTTWPWLHKIRKSMRRVGRDTLEGTVEVDETCLGGSKPGKRGRGAEGKTLVCITLEKKGT
jgi:hypothetical protein